MFKFLVYLFLFYTVTRFIFGTLLNFKKSNNTQDNSTSAFDDEEIKVKPNKTTSNSSNKKTNSNIGEYVDFEEIK